MKKKILVAITALSIVLCVAMGTTLAWLLDETDSIENTFTYGNITIDLVETTGDIYEMVPGKDIEKDPKVIVEGGSEACWLFVKVEKSDNFDDFMNLPIDSEWTALTGVDGIYYLEVAKSDDDQEFYVIQDSTLTVFDSITKEDFSAVADDLPTLTFTAYAVQKDVATTALEAWNDTFGAPGQG